MAENYFKITAYVPGEKVLDAYGVLQDIEGVILEPNLAQTIKREEEAFAKRIERELDEADAAGRIISVVDLPED